MTDGQGQVPAHPIWGQLEAATENSLCGHSIEDNSNGEWSGGWDCDNTDDQQIMVRVWVAAPGYVTTTFSQTIPGSGNAGRMFPPDSARPLTLSSTAAAEAALRLTLYKPKQLPPGAALDRVEIQVNQYDGSHASTTTQFYRLPTGAWLELTQLDSTDHYSGAGWGRARYDYEAQSVTVSGEQGYLIRQFGWWYLDWKVGEVGFELQSPVEALSSEELTAIAASLR